MTTSPTWLDSWMAVGQPPEAIPLTIPLNEDQNADPLDLSHIAAPDRWAYQLQHLATQGFISWLQEREPSLAGNELEIAPAVPLQIGSFKVCLIPTSLNEDEVAVPQAVIEPAAQAHHLAAHFYVAIAVDEEAEVASLVGFLSYDELTDLCNHISLDADQTYPLPTAELNPDFDALLLFLQCLSPSAIALPDGPSSERPSLAALVESMGQPLANARTWLQRQADTLLPDSGWQPIPAMAMRRDISSMRDQLTEALRFHSVPTLPASAGSAYQSITLAGSTLRLFGAAWPLPETDEEWMLLTILCPAPGQTFPPGLSLAIDEITPGRSRVELARETFTADNPRAALFAQVKGDRDDVFDITLTVTGSEQRWSTAIQFQPEA